MPLAEVTKIPVTNLHKLRLRRAEANDPVGFLLHLIEQMVERAGIKIH